MWRNLIPYARHCFDGRAYIYSILAVHGHIAYSTEYNPYKRGERYTMRPQLRLGKPGAIFDSFLGSLDIKLGKSLKPIPVVMIANKRRGDCPLIRGEYI